MPLLTLAAQRAPAGCEALAYAALTTCLDLGDEASQLTTSALTKALVIGAPPTRSWQNLPVLMILARYYIQTTRRSNLMSDCSTVYIVYDAMGLGWVSV